MDNEEQTNLPDRKPEGVEDKYYDVDVTCTGNDEKTPVTGTWDYNAWNLKLENVTQGTKCKLAFSSTDSKEEYTKHLEEGIALRRNTYRGKDLTSYFRDKKQEFYESISKGEFADIYVGDYIESPNSQKEDGPKDISGGTVRWLIADIDNYLYTGDQGGLKSHHVTIIPAKPLTTAKMNDTNTTAEGYANSAMVKANESDPLGTGTLKTVYDTYISKDFEAEHVLPYRTWLTNKTDSNLTNRFGTQNGGASSSSTWYTRKLDLMSEMNVYGGIVASSSMYDTGIDNRQYAIFRLKPELISSYNGQQFTTYTWLKDVASSTHFAYACYTGASYASDASIQLGVRPRFLIG